jgi:hypothetical protein
VSWTGLERRWLMALIEAMIPPLPPRDDKAAVPAIDPVSATRGVEVLLGGMPGLQRLALRFAVWLVSWVGPLFIGQLPTFRRLSSGDRDRVLVRMGGSDNFVIREMVVLLKLVAGLVRELDPAFGPALGWGVGEPVRIEGAEL